MHQRSMNSPARHISVLCDEVLRVLDPHGRKVLVDCTAGLGGHAEALLDAAGEQAQLIAIDLDEQNLRLAKERLGRFGGRARLFQANFADVKEVLAEAGLAAADVLLADIGFASSQMDDPLRGFAFTADGPLDMRLDCQQEITAAKLVNSLGQDDLADLIYRYGEERYSRRIARAIVAARKSHPIDRTKELADIVISAYPGAARASRRGVHPATRTFQAIRIAVNRELENLQRLLDLLPDVLSPGGRAGVISFHSLEDRLVKRAFADWSASGRARLLCKKPIGPSESEMIENPRSRSAKLRAIEKL
jgi:16S rRNA (cytosine1402-N4)-methyltransferase